MRSIISLRHVTAFAAATVVLFGAACGDDPVSAKDLEPCTDDVTITVSSGTTPTFSWTPACTVGAVLVEEDASDVWGITGPDGGIAPGIRYGNAMTGSDVWQEPETLVKGTTYDVILFAAGNELRMLGIKQFTPQ